MLLAKVLCKPYNHTGVMACGIHKQLPKMIVIGFFKLVLNDYWSIAVDVGSKNIERVATDWSLCLLEF